MTLPVGLDLTDRRVVVLGGGPAALPGILALVGAQAAVHVIAPWVCEDAAALVATGEIAWSDLFNVIRDTPGVRKMGDARLDLTLNGLPADVRLNVREFPVLRTVTLVNGDTGELL